MREVDGKWLPTLWRFCDGPQEDGFDQMGVAQYGKQDLARGLSFYKSANAKPSVVSGPTSRRPKSPTTSTPSTSAPGACWSTGTRAP